MNTTARRTRPSRARVYGEVVGRIMALHHLHEDERVLVWLTSTADDSRRAQFVADRTLYFGKKRVFQGEYSVSCQTVFGGMVNGFHAGFFRVEPGVNLLYVQGRGSVLRGRVRGLPRPTPNTLSLELLSHEDPRVVHAALVDHHSRFFFSSLKPGRYTLEGRMLGYGVVTPRTVDVPAKGTTVLRDIEFQQTPHVRFRLRTKTGRPYRGRAEVLLRDVASGSDQWNHSHYFHLSTLGELALPNEFRGEYQFRLKPLWKGYTPVEGRLELDGREVTVPVDCIKS